MRNEEYRDGFMLALEYVQELFNPPGAWIQNKLAMNSRGVHVIPESPEAAYFCIVGAVCQVASRVRRELGTYSCPISTLGDEINQTRDNYSERPDLVEWNNDPARTQEDIRKVIQDTLERLREEKRNHTK